MIKPIMKDVFFLRQKSQPATVADLQVGQDLLDTLAAHKQECVGMAANMIGVKKNIIVIDMGFMPLVMFNPKIVSKKDPFETEEGCLSLTGVRKTISYKEIVVEYQDINFKKQTMKLTGFPAQVALHEIRHTEGIII